jgi:NACHT domain
VLVNPADVAAVADGVVVNAAWAVAGMVAKPRTARRVAADLDTATWADTGRLIKDALAEIAASRKIPDLSEAEAAELAGALHRPEVQGALQALLAARLTDAPETDAGRARQVLAARLAARDAVRLAVGGVASPAGAAGTGAGRPERRRSSPAGTPSPSPRTSGTSGTSGGAAVAGTGPVAARYAEELSEYLDDRVSALVATLEGRVGFEGLAQVRAEAYNSRIVALLGTLADMVAALAHPGRGGLEEDEFLRRYRRQVRERHGKLDPPDFERRRRVPVAEIYVPTAVNQDFHPERNVAPRASQPSSLTVRDLAARLYRTVLLGDPGGGKTTAANVLANRFASDADWKVPLLVTLRDYAAKDPPERSVAGHIEQTLATLYQCPAPAGLVERLLLTGRAIVIFDGLDELLDTSRRAEVSARVEQFCAAYPLAPVLVTSRLVGYDEARLDDDQFSCYRLDGFGEDEVGEYARKWFALQEGFSAAEAEAEATAFLAESASVPDLRANPLLLSLMCILYRGEGFLPRNRAEVYEQCATLLFRKWDLRRRIHQELRAGHLVEPAIRHLAWWLFDREDPQTAVTESQLIDEATAFLHGREFESADDARDAAREFVEFCRGRMWVLSDAGTTADGKKLYAFTHRTFLEYFAAAHLAAKSDTPEELAQTLAPRLQDGGWEIVGELAIQIKGRTADRGADRIFTALLDATKSEQGGTTQDAHVLSFMGDRLGSVDLSPRIVRKLTRAVLDYLTTDGMASYAPEPLLRLLTHSGRSQGLISDELTNRVTDLVASDDAEQRRDGLQLMLWVDWVTADTSPWLGWAEESAHTCAAEIASAANGDVAFRNWVISRDFISLEQGLAMSGGLAALMESATATIPPNLPAYPLAQLLFLYAKRLNPDDTEVDNLAVIGQHLLNQEWPPRVHISPSDNISNYRYNITIIKNIYRDEIPFPDWNDEQLSLGISTIMCIGIELTDLSESDARVAAEQQKTGPGSLLHRYITRRLTHDADELPDLPVPAQFRQVFRDWAEGRVDFVEFVDG